MNVWMFLISSSPWWLILLNKLTSAARTGCLYFKYFEMGGFVINILKRAVLPHLRFSLWTMKHSQQARIGHLSQEDKPWVCQIGQNSFSQTQRSATAGSRCRWNWLGLESFWLLLYHRKIYLRFSKMQLFDYPKYILISSIIKYLSLIPFTSLYFPHPSNDSWLGLRFLI